MMHEKLTRSKAPRKESSNSSTGSIPSTPRGPPRKPKQSGHALWVGNLPSGTVIGDLKDHFSRDATKDIESVFLISKSNCAFVNYRTEATCAAAMTRFHDSRFHGVRLVCRLRRNNAGAALSSPGIPSGPAALMSIAPYSPTAFDATKEHHAIMSKREATEPQRTGELVSKVNDKYFVMKSLTVEDMELSVRNCIWATQAHNEDALNKAYEVPDPWTLFPNKANVDRLRKMYTLSFLPTNLENILASHVWPLQSQTKLQQVLTGLQEGRPSSMILTYPDRYQRRPPNSRQKVVSSTTLQGVRSFGKLSPLRKSWCASSIRKFTILETSRRLTSILMMLRTLL